MHNDYMVTVADKRQLILDAAQHVFAEKGFHTSTMDAVAEAAGVAKALSTFISRERTNSSLSLLMTGRDD